MIEIVGGIFCLGFVILVFYGLYWEIKHMKAACDKERQQTAMYARILEKLEEEENG